MLIQGFETSPKCMLIQRKFKVFNSLCRFSERWKGCQRRQKQSNHLQNTGAGLCTVPHLLVVCLALWTICNLRVCSWPSSSFYVSFSISFGLVATSLCQASQRTTHSLRNLQNACSLQTGQGDGYWVVAFNSLLCTLRLTLICIVPISDSCFYYLSEDLNVRTLFLLNG